MKNKKIFKSLCSAVLLSALVMTAGSTALAAGTEDVVVVHISNLAFSPAEITVKPGTTVRWVNDDPFSHDVTSGSVVSGRRARQVSRSTNPDGRFHSGSYGKDSSFRHVFTEEGSYPYYCTIHPIMMGLVRVVR